jgi:hypothetical protein
MTLVFEEKVQKILENADKKFYPIVFELKK